MVDMKSMLNVHILKSWRAFFLDKRHNRGIGLGNIHWHEWGQNQWGIVDMNVAKDIDRDLSAGGKWKYLVQTLECIGSIGALVPKLPNCLSVDQDFSYISNDATGENVNETWRNCSVTVVSLIKRHHSKYRICLTRVFVEERTVDTAKVVGRWVVSKLAEKVMRALKDNAPVISHCNSIAQPLPSPQ